MRFAGARSRASSSRRASWTTQRSIGFRGQGIGSCRGGPSWAPWPAGAWRRWRGWGLRRTPSAASIAVARKRARRSASRAPRTGNAAPTPSRTALSRLRRPRRSVAFRWGRSTASLMRIAAGRTPSAALMAARRGERPAATAGSALDGGANCRPVPSRTRAVLGRFSGPSLSRKNESRRVDLAAVARGIWRKEASQTAQSGDAI